MALFWKKILTNFIILWIMVFYGGKTSEEVMVATVRSVECGVEVINNPQQIYVSKKM